MDIGATGEVTITPYKNKSHRLRARRSRGPWESPPWAAGLPDWLMRCLLSVICVAAGTAARCPGYGQQFSTEAQGRAVPMTQFDGVFRYVVKDEGAPKPRFAAIRTAAMNHAAIEEKHVAGC